MNHTITLPHATFKRLEKLSASSKISAASLVNQAVGDRLDYEEWLDKQVDAGIADIEAGRVHSSEEVRKRLGIQT